MAAPDEVRFVLLGKTGSGKSSAGNVILGEEKFEVSADPDGVTQDCQTEKGNFKGKKIKVTDTPGIFDPMRSEEDLKYSIISCLTECTPGPHTFILMLKVGRYTEEEKESVRMTLKWFGEEALKHTVVLFTHGDELKENQTIKEYVKKNKDLEELVDKCEGRVHVIDSQQWNKKDDKNAQSADLLEKLKKMMIEKREAGESRAVLALEEVKNMLLEPKSATLDHEPGQGSERSTNSGGNPDESEYRSNSFQIKQLLTTTDNMVRENEGRCYTNESLQVIAEAIDIEFNKIKEEMEERGEKAEESVIRRRARERVRNKTLRLVAGVTIGALLGALLGVPVGISIPVTFGAGFLKELLTGDCTHPVDTIVRAVRTAGILGSGAAGTLGAGAGAARTLGAGAGAAAGIGAGVAAGVLATAGAIGGGVEGAKAAGRADTPKEAAENAAEAVVERAGNLVKEAWEVGQRLTKTKETPYKLLQ